MNLKQFKNELAVDAYGMAPDGKVCIECRNPPVRGKNIQTDAGQREFEISGLCETCFDKIFDND